MELSVLMSVYKNDQCQHLNEAIESVFEQSVQPTELIIVKDGPVSSEIEDLLQDWKRIYQEKIKLVPLVKNLGLAKALNEGLKHCSHEFVARMDSDDVNNFDRFEAQLEYLDSHPDIALIGSWYKQYDESMKNIVTERKVPEDHDSITRYAQHRTPINHVTIMFRKSAVLAIGGYPEREGRFEDWWLSLKLIQNGYKLHNLPLYLVKVRGGGDFIKRRGGVRYLMQEINNLHQLKSEKLISVHAFIMNVCIRTLVRLFPNVLRDYSYKLIRKI